MTASGAGGTECGYRRGGRISQDLTSTPWWLKVSRMGVCEELRALAGVVDRLAGKFPDVPRGMIEEVVEQQHRALDTGKVRDFVPILVEHAARDRLAH